MKEYKVKINVQKTKVMKLNNRDHENCRNGRENTTGWEVQILDSMLLAKWKSENEVKTRIAMAEKAFNTKNLFCSNMDLEMRKTSEMLCALFCCIDVKCGFWGRKIRIELRRLIYKYGEEWRE